MAVEYVEYLESVGVRIVPLIYHGDIQRNFELLRHINGLVIPGGKKNAEYGRFVSQIYQEVKEMNDRGNYFPIWGIGMGALELLNEEVAPGYELLVERSMQAERVPLEFTKPPEESRMWGYIGKKAYNFTLNNFTYFETSLGVDPAQVRHVNSLSKMFEVTAITYDKYGFPMVAAFESERYPFYGTTFLPQTAGYSYHPDVKADHSYLSVQFNRYCAEHFVLEVKTNLNAFDTYGEEVWNMVENRKVVLINEKLQEVYLF